MEKHYSDKEPKRHYLDDDQTFKFLEVWDKYFVALQCTPRTVRLRTVMAEDLRALGVQINPVQVKNRIENMTKTFRSQLREVKANPNAKKWRFFDMVADLFEKHRVEINAKAIKKSAHVPSVGHSFSENNTSGEESCDAYNSTTGGIITPAESGGTTGSYFALNASSNSYMTSRSLPVAYSDAQPPHDVGYRDPNDGGVGDATSNPLSGSVQQLNGGCVSSIQRSWNVLSDGETSNGHKNCNDDVVDATNGDASCANDTQPRLAYNNTGANDVIETGNRTGSENPAMLPASNSPGEGLISGCEVPLPLNGGPGAGASARRTRRNSSGSSVNMPHRFLPYSGTFYRRFQSASSKARMRALIEEMLDEREERQELIRVQRESLSLQREILAEKRKQTRTLEAVLELLTRHIGAKQQPHAATASFSNQLNHHHHHNNNNHHHASNSAPNSVAFQHHNNS